MAGEWLKFDCTLPEKPEVLAITVAMGWDDPDLTVGKLMRVFRWFDQHTIDGNARGVTAALLDRLIGVAGFVQAMCDVGWIVVSSEGLSLHSFEKHNGASAKSRAQTAKRVANHRANAGETQAPKARNARSVTGALAREEKRREEEIPPKPPKGGKCSLPDWITAIKAKGETAIPEGDPVFAYARSVGIPDEFLSLAWREFRRRYSEPGSTKYVDWRKVFRNAVEGNWLKLWWLNGQEYQLTTTGLQAQRFHGDKAA